MSESLRLELEKDFLDLAQLVAIPAARVAVVSELLELSELSELERARLANLKHPKAWQEYLRGLAAKKTLFGDRRPYGWGADFSLSHSGGYAACVTSSSACRIGLDLQVNKTLSPRLKDRLESFNNQNNLDPLALFCLGEALFKAGLGTNLFSGLQGLELKGNKGKVSWGEERFEFALFRREAFFLALVYRNVSACP